MFRFAIVEIKGKQYLTKPNTQLKVDYLGDVKNLECDRVLLLVNGENIELGKPYLSSKIVFDVEGEEKGEKIRVAKFHAKANYRKVKGHRAIHSIISHKVREDIKTKGAKDVK